VETVQVPAIAQNQILVRVKATSVNPADAKQRSGNLKLVLKHSFPVILGQDFSGIVERVGSACTQFAVGDAVFGTTEPGRGCNAEFVAVFESEASHKPPSLSWAAVAATPTAALTGYKGMVTLGNVRAGHRLLILGCAGGVGSAAAQIAVAQGCEVFGTCSTHNRQYVQSLGVQPLDYNENFAAELGDSSLDLVFDAVGGDDYYNQTLPKLKPGGQYLSAVGPVRHGGSEPITVGTICTTAGVLIPRLIANLWTQRRYSLFLAFDPPDLKKDELLRFIEEQRLQVRIDPTIYRLADLAKAHAQIETNHSSGKLVIIVNDS